MKQKILVIQTAFIGDAILATGILEKLHNHLPESKIDYMVRKGNETLFTNHPFINKLIVWNKKDGKYKSLLNILKQIRKEEYDYVVNVQRFAATGFLTAFSKAKVKVGFNKNPLSFLFDVKVKHEIGTPQNSIHEIERNQKLIESIVGGKAEKPKLYPSKNDYEFVAQYQTKKYYCIAPASVWFTKQYPKHKWIELINALPKEYNIYLLGASSDVDLCNEIINGLVDKSNTTNLAEKVSFLQSVALIQNATMNFVNDSAPMHLASSVNAATTAIYCSTLPTFGFGPLSNHQKIIEIEEKLACRPCGLHGRRECPLGHFKCANEIKLQQLL